MEKQRRWYYLIPLMGGILCVWYLYLSFYDVVYSDYIRQVNSYLPDVWNPKKFFVRDVLTRIPVNYLMRIVNTTWFHYSIRFDQALGVLSLMLSAAVIACYCIREKIDTVWYLILMAVFFSLNKWEMMNNGSGWVHFFAYAGFYYHYLVWERVWTGKEKKGDQIKMLVLPWLITMGVAGPYCAAYSGVLLLGYGFCMVITWKKTRTWDKRYLLYGICVILPLLCYLWSTSHVNTGLSSDGSLFRQFVDTPGFFVRFFIKSLCSTVIGGEAATEVFHTNTPYMVIGVMVGAAYLLALWYQLRYKIYEDTLFPLILIVSGGMNHCLILISRWSFLIESYGMSSRYALQFQVGILGILLTFAFVWRRWHGEREKDQPLEAQKVRKKNGQKKKQVQMAAIAGMVVVFLAGNGYTTWREIRMTKWRKEACVNRAVVALDFENRTNEELAASFEYHTSSADAGELVRNALTILKEHHWNVFNR